MFQFDGDKKRKMVMQLQLAPMIDVFVLIIVFLLKGTILEESAIVLPPGVELAQSQSKETSQLAPQVIISRDTVTFKMIEKSRPVEDFSKDDFSARDPIVEEFKNFLLINKNVEGTNLVNIIGDANTNYKIIYNVVKLLRVSGFQSMLFVAEGESP
jgi:biopolymer transport protein ExbD